MLRMILILLMSFTMSYIAYAKISMPAIFGDHMVLQQNTEVEIWGWAKPAEDIKVTGSWDNQTYTVKPNSSGEWTIKIKTPAAGGPYSLTVEAYNKIVFNDVLIGEVWLASGQSNMEWSAQLGIDNAEEEISKADYPDIRFFHVMHRTADTPQRDLDGQWVKCTPETFKQFSAVAYYFGREIHDKIKVPVGLIHSSWGGTHAEVWMPSDIIENDEEFSALAKIYNPTNVNPKVPGSTFNAMIAPIIPFTIAGVLWYQGESNVAKHQAYGRLFTELISGWRQRWGYELPFYYVQIAPFNYQTNLAGAALRDAQRKAMDIPKTGMAVTQDIGNVDDIHPQNKKDVGKRLALWALKELYGFDQIINSGPLFKDFELEKGRVRLLFDFAEEGLILKDNKTSGFEVAGEDRIFYPAKATIQGNSILISSKKVKVPKAVRYAFTNTSPANLFNKSGLPASSFRTDNWAIE